MGGVRELVRNFVLESLIFDRDNEWFTDETNLKGQVDSLALLQLVTFVEDQFNIELHAEELDHGAPVSVSSVERLVLSKMGVES